MFTEPAGLTPEQENEFKKYQASAESFRDFLESITAFCDDSVLLLFIQTYFAGYYHIAEPFYMARLRNSNLLLAWDQNAGTYTLVSEKEAKEKGFTYEFHMEEIKKAQNTLGIYFDSNLITQVSGG